MASGDVSARRRALRYDVGQLADDLRPGPAIPAARGGAEAAGQRSLSLRVHPSTESLKAQAWPGQS